jgi:hypothetical protein
MASRRLPGVEHSVLQIAERRPENSSLLVVVFCLKLRKHLVPLLVIFALPAGATGTAHIRPKRWQRCVYSGFAAKHARVHSSSAHSYHPSPNSRRQCQQRYLPFTGREIALWNTRQYALPIVVSARFWTPANREVRDGLAKQDSDALIRFSRQGVGRRNARCCTRLVKVLVCEITNQLAYEDYAGRPAGQPVLSVPRKVLVTRSFPRLPRTWFYRLCFDSEDVATFACFMRK